MENPFTCITELKDTADMMVSENYKERFRAEFYQTNIRMHELLNIIRMYDGGTLEFTLSCPIDLLRTQARRMADYLNVLIERAKVEGIEL